MSKSVAGGVYANQRLNLGVKGKAHGRKAKASNRTREIRLSGSVSRRKLVCSVRVSPTKAKVRNLVAWMAGRRETKSLKPIDKAICKEGEQVIGPQRK